SRAFGGRRFTRPARAVAGFRCRAFGRGVARAALPAGTCYTGRAMSRVLITAFEPYPPWEANSSWLCLMELTRDLPRFDGLTTRRYPVDFAAVRSRLEKELQAGFDVVLHLGQAPGSGSLRLEQFALNVGGEPSQPAEAFAPLEM